MKETLANLAGKATDMAQTVKEFLQYFSSGDAWHDFVMHAILYLVIGIVAFVLVNTVFDSVRNFIRGLDVTLIGAAIAFIGFKLKDIPLLNEFSNPMLIIGGILAVLGLILFVVFKKAGRLKRKAEAKVSDLVRKEEASTEAITEATSAAEESTHKPEPVAVKAPSGIKRGLKVVLAVIIAFAVGFGAGQFIDIFPGSSDGASVDSVKGMLKDNLELSVMEYDYEEVVTLDPTSLQIKGKNIPFTKKTAQVQFSGTAKLGPDMEKAEIDVDEQSMKINITIPHSTILSNSIDESTFEVKNEKNGLFNKVDLEDSSKVRQKGKEAVEQKIKDEKMLDQADDRAKEKLADLLEGAYKGYKVVVNID